MAEQDDSTDDSQKTEDPTPRKLEEARKKGQVVYSREVNNLVVVTAATALIVMAGPEVMGGISDTLSRFLSMPHAMAVDANGMKHLLRGLFLDVGGLLAVPLLILIAAAVLSGFAQTGPIFTFETMKPDLSKISFAKGFQRLFSGKSVAELVKSILKMVIVSVAGLMAINPYFGAVDHFVGQDLGQAMFDLEDMFLRMMIAVLSVLFVIAVVDYVYQRHVFMRDMRMSRQEMKDEFKQTEGDPHIKAKLRQLREQKARQRMMQSVPEADVVITNPTHYAVALKYNPKEMNAPVMVAKGADSVALKIREVAREHKVPVVENPPLARALHDSMEIDQMIPAEHWKAVAEVISYVFKLKGRRV